MDGCQIICYSLRVSVGNDDEDACQPAHTEQNDIERTLPSLSEYIGSSAAIHHHMVSLAAPLYVYESGVDKQK